MAFISFLNQNPTLNYVIIAILILIVLKLITPAFRQVITTPVEKLSASIEAQTKVITEVKKEFKEHREEVAKDREKDRHERGLMLDRMQKQETLCETTRSLCPGLNGQMNCNTSNQSFNHNTQA